MKLPDLHDKKTQLALGGAGAVVAFALYRKHVANAAAASSSSGTVTDPTATQAFDASTLENGIVGDLQPEIDSLAAQLAGLKPGSPAPTPPGKKPPTKTKLPPVNATQFPVSIPASGLPGDPFVGLGVLGANGSFTGHNVVGGAPVYALEGNTAVQNFDPRKLPKGTRLVTLKKFAAYINPATVTEQL